MSQVPASLAQHFETPDGFTGHFGWLCGFSADDSFLNDALERFTHRQANQRAYTGDTSLALLLDPRAPQITPIEVPGLLHLPWAKAALPFNLMHAKVAVLTYRSTARSDVWSVRLLVCTGNWTRQTLEHSLDLVWRLDLHSDDLRSPTETTQQARTDISGAWDLLSWLRRQYDGRVLLANPLTAKAITDMDTLLFKQIKLKAPGLSARFFDNRTASLLAQLPAKVVSVSGRGVARNYLAMGSGFYESSLLGKTPSVPLQVVRGLRGEGGGPRLLTMSSDVNLFVNEGGCQGVVEALAMLTAADISVRPAAQPGYFSHAQKRTLHAKFIFSASETGHSNKTANPWLYLGSGNLTPQGFTLKMGRHLGNLEAGVVFAPTPLNWHPQHMALADPESIGYYLPIQRQLTCRPEALQTGGALEVGSEVFSAARVAYLMWREAQTSEQGWLSSEDGLEVDYVVLDPSRQPCTYVDGQGFTWCGQRPRQVVVRWQAENTEQFMTVPVLDGFGRLAATELPNISLEDAWRQLEGFPQLPSEEELPDAFDHSVRSGSRQENFGRAQGTASYPIRQMMELIEGIAAKQTALAPIDWPVWCARLEQSLIQASGCGLLQAFLALNLNPIHALRQAAFRPHFAETPEHLAGQRYEAALNHIEAHWALDHLHPLGAPA